MPHYRDRRDKPGDDALLGAADSKRPETAQEAAQKSGFSIPAEAAQA
jgi:hypothetical protein